MATLEPSSLPGMCAIPAHSGIPFRVWHPHAQEIYVTGTSSDWDSQRDLCYQERIEEPPSFGRYAYPSFKDGMPYSDRIGIGPYTAIVLSQDR
jgi:hypothetical protein